MSLDNNSPSRIYEQEATDIKTKKKHHIKMTGMQMCGFGVFSNVYKGVLLSRDGNRTIAVKKTFPESKKKDETTFETKFLSLEGRRPHKNIIHMMYFFSNRVPGGASCDSFVFEYMPETLDAVIKNYHLNSLDIKLYSWQIFNGLHYCSRLDVAHRDLKPVNILVDHASGILKISDFGSAKVIRSNEPASSYQVTRYYRPPELLMGAKSYTWRVDVWSGGCCVAEMMKKSVLLRGRDSKHQLMLIVRILGTPSEADLNSMRVHARFEGEHQVGRGWANVLPNASPEAMNFLQRVMVYKPKERLCGLQLLKDGFFKEVFAPGARRQNGHMICEVLDKNDLAFAELDEVEVQCKQDKKMEKSAEAMKNKPTGVAVIKVPINSPSDDAADNHRHPRPPRGTVMPRSRFPSKAAVARKAPENASVLQQPRMKKSSNARSKYVMHK